MYKRFSILTVLLFCPLFLFAKVITIYHTSDTHGFFYPQNGQGGFAALASVIKQGPQPYLLLDSGDFANGTAETRFSKGMKAIEMLNALDYDAVTVGNHEFDFKDKQIPALFEKAELIPLVIDQVGEDAEIKALAESLREPGIDEPLGRTTAPRKLCAKL